MFFFLSDYWLAFWADTEEASQYNTTVSDACPSKVLLLSIVPIGPSFFYTIDRCRVIMITRTLSLVHKYMCHPRPPCTSKMDFKMAYRTMLHFAPLKGVTHGKHNPKWRILVFLCRAPEHDTINGILNK